MGIGRGMKTTPGSVLLISTQRMIALFAPGEAALEVLAALRLIT